MRGYFGGNDEHSWKQLLNFVSIHDNGSKTILYSKMETFSNIYNKGRVDEDIRTCRDG